MMAFVKQAVLSSPPTRLVRTTDTGLVIESRSLLDERTRPWTASPIPYPDGCKPHTFVILCAIALEWAVDLVVQYELHNLQEHTEVWRVWPWGLATEPAELTVEGKPISPLVSAEPLKPEDRAEDNSRIQPIILKKEVEDGQRIYALKMNLILFQHHVELVTRSPLRHDVMISYKAQDAENFAEAMEKRLRALGLNVWFAPAQWYANFDERIQSVIQQAHAFLVILSEHSCAPAAAQSQYIKDPTEQKMSQKREIELIKRASKDDRKRTVFLCNLLDDETPLPAEVDALIDDRWHVHTRRGSATRLCENPGELPSDGDFKDDLAKHIKRALQSDDE